MRGFSWFISAFISLLLIILVFVIIAATNMKIEGEVNTYMPFRYAVMVAHRLSSSQETLSQVFQRPDLTSHKNLLDVKKLDYFKNNYGQKGKSFWENFDIALLADAGKMSPESHLFCYHWRAEVKDYEAYKKVKNPVYYMYPACRNGNDELCPVEEEITLPKSWIFGRSYMADQPSEALENQKELWSSFGENMNEVVTQDFEMAMPAVAVGVAVTAAAVAAPATLGTSVLVVGATTAILAGGFILGETARRTAEHMAEFQRDAQPASYVLPVGIVYDETNETHIGSLQVWAWKAHSECANKALNDDILAKVKTQGRLLLEGEA